MYADTVANEFVLVRSFAEFKDYIIQYGLPDFISFDNDLGLDSNGELAPDGFHATKWLVYESGFNLINLKFKVHSANPIASVQIKSLLDNYIRHLKSSTEALTPEPLS